MADRYPYRTPRRPQIPARIPFGADPRGELAKALDAGKTERADERIQLDKEKNALEVRKAGQKDAALAIQKVLAETAVEKQMVATNRALNDAAKLHNEQAQLPAFETAVHSLNRFDPEFAQDILALEQKYAFASASKEGKRIARDAKQQAGMEYTDDNGHAVKFPDGIQTKYRHAEDVLGLENFRDMARYDAKTGDFISIDAFAVHQAVKAKEMEAVRNALHPHETATVSPTGAATIHVAGPTPATPTKPLDVLPEHEEAVNAAGDKKANELLGMISDPTAYVPANMLSAIEDVRSRPKAEQMKWVQEQARNTMQSESNAQKAASKQKPDRYAAHVAARKKLDSLFSYLADLHDPKKTKVMDAKQVPKEIEKTQAEISKLLDESSTASAAPTQQQQGSAANPAAGKTAAPLGNQPPSAKAKLDATFGNQQSPAPTSATPNTPPPKPQLPGKKSAMRKPLDDVAETFPSTAAKPEKEYIAGTYTGSDTSPEADAKDHVALETIRGSDSRKVAAESAAKSYAEMYQPHESGKDWAERRMEDERNNGDWKKDSWGASAPDFKASALSEAADRKQAFESSLADLGHTPEEIAQVTAYARTGQVPQFELQNEDGLLGAPPRVVAKIPNPAEKTASSE